MSGESVAQDIEKQVERAIEELELPDTTLPREEELRVLQDLRLAYVRDFTIFKTNARVNRAVDNPGQADHWQKQAEMTLRLLAELDKDIAALRKGTAL